MQTFDPRDILAEIPLFADVLDDAQLGRLAARCQVAVFPAGTPLVSEGDFGTSMFAIAEGSVSVTLADQRGGPHKVATLGRGDVVGEMSLMTGARRNATATAVDDVAAVEITKVALEEVLARAPDLIDSFGTVLARRQAERDRVALDAARTSASDIVGQIRRFFSSGR